jgi:hypothetical protein
MKKLILGPTVLFVLVFAAFLTSFVFGAQSSGVSEAARTLQLIAPYRTWGKANVQPIVVPVDQAAAAG